MSGNRTTLKNLTDIEKDKDYYFDYSFWSHDGFKIESNGMLVPEDEYSIYAD